MVIHTSEIIYVATALVCSSIGAFYDVKERRIPNALTGASIVLGAMLHLVYGGLSQLASCAIAGLIAGSVFIVLFLLGGMGAGDVKLMAGVGCMVGLGPLPEIMIATVASGALYALVLGFRSGRLRQVAGNMKALAAHHHERGWQPHPELNIENVSMLHLPYAVAIAAGCLVTVCTMAAGAR